MCLIPLQCLVWLCLFASDDIQNERDWCYRFRTDGIAGLNSGKDDGSRFFVYYVFPADCLFTGYDLIPIRCQRYQNTEVRVSSLAGGNPWSAMVSAFSLKCLLHSLDCNCTRLVCTQSRRLWLQLRDKALQLRPRGGAGGIFPALPWRDPGTIRTRCRTKYAPLWSDHGEMYASKDMQIKTIIHGGVIITNCWNSTIWNFPYKKKPHKDILIPILFQLSSAAGVCSLAFRRFHWESYVSINYVNRYIYCQNSLKAELQTPIVSKAANWYQIITNVLVFKSVTFSNNPI